MATCQERSLNTKSDIETVSKDESSPNQNHDSEETPLLGKGSQTSKLECHNNHNNKNSKYRNRCCLSSRTALLILLWNFLITFGIASFVDPSFYTGALLLLPGNNDNSSAPLKLDFYKHRLEVSGVTYGINAFLLLFYPVAGYLADVRFGRHKMILYSLYIVFCSALAIAVLGIPPWLVYIISEEISSSIKIVSYVGLPILGLGIFVILFSLISFSANVIQYGIDQLRDSSSEDLVLYIHWYVWTTYLGTLLRTPFMFKLVALKYIPCILPLFIVILGASLCLQRWKKHWYLVDSGSRNPYKLVYKVIKFAAEHTSPIHRSAFTYCEDELPSRLDFGKEKYGGPFTTEQVENVKAFLGILSVFLTLGPILIAEIAVRGFLPNFAFHIDSEIYAGHDHSVSTKTLIGNGSLQTLLVVILIPLYLCLLRPVIHNNNYIPRISMLKRMGLGMIMLLLSALCTLSMDVYGHIKMYEANSTSTACVLSDEYSHSFNNSNQFLNISSNYLAFQCFFNAVGYILLYTAAFEFICAQSPYSMKGLLIGTFFAVRGLFNLLGIVIVFAPFTGWLPLSDNRISCGIVYYSINVVIAFVGVIIYSCVARQYQYRERDEPDNVYRYAEEYYAKARDESNYDYDDDYDNLKVETTT